MHAPGLARKAGFLVLALLIAIRASAATDAVVREQVLAPAVAARAEADEARASLLAPRLYAAGMDKYSAAVERFERGGNLERIRRDVSEASGRFGEAAETARIAARVLEKALLARADAQSAEATRYARDAWTRAEDRFSRATRNVEGGDLKDADQDGQEAERLYREAELVAIKANYLDETRTLLEEARRARAERLAPRTYQSALALLGEAERELDANRYDTDRPRSLASDAKHEARHAIYIAGVAREIGSDELEELLLAWEAPLRKLAGQLDVAVHFDEGFEAAGAALGKRVADLLDERERLERDLAARDEEVARLGERIGGELAELNRELQRQARLRDRIAQVERAFGPQEAQVLRRRGQVILRLVGLSFAVGSAELRGDHQALLEKMKQAIALFPTSFVVVEGHTDAYGSDEANLQLSQRRAEAVRSYVLANMPVSPASISAVGYGEAQPVASNETQEGRAKNRRIDVVIDASQ